MSQAHSSSERGKGSPASIFSGIPLRLRKTQNLEFWEAASSRKEFWNDWKEAEINCTLLLSNQSISTFPSFETKKLDISNCLKSAWCSFQHLLYTRLQLCTICKALLWREELVATTPQLFLFIKDGNQSSRGALFHTVRWNCKHERWHLLLVCWKTLGKSPHLWYQL